MKTKIFTLIVAGLFCTQCAVIGGYPITNFYVKNNSVKPITFEATVFKYNIRQNVTVPFLVKPNDSVLARQVGYKKGGENPQSWFNGFHISDVNDVKIFDPNKPENWVKLKDKNGRTFYTFTIAE